jgi:hypothetical protein
MNGIYTIKQKLTSSKNERCKARGTMDCACIGVETVPQSRLLLHTSLLTASLNKRFGV